MTLFLRRWLSGAAGILLPLLLAGAVASGPAQAVETPGPANGKVAISPTSAAPGETVGVWTTGWKPGTQLQAVVCGQLAVNGSNDCDVRGAVTSASDAKGEARHTLTLAMPPVACPCVVRVSTFTAPALAVNVPLDIKGHRMKVVPEKDEVSYDLRVEDVDLAGGGGLTAFLGLGGSTTMRITLANRGAATVDAPPLTYAFGRGDIAPTVELDPDVRVPAGGTAEVEVEVDVPMLAFGSHQAVAQWADGSGNIASAGTSVYPVGAVLVLFLGFAGVVVHDLRHTGRARLEELLLSTPGAHRFLDEDDSYPLPDVVYVEDLGGYLVKPAVLKNSRVTKRLTGRVSVRDLAALVEGGGEAVASYPDGTPAVEERSGGGGLAYFLFRDRDPWRS